MDDTNHMAHGQAGEGRQGPSELPKMLAMLARRKWAEDDFVQWGEYTGTSFPNWVWKDPDYQRIKQLGWCVMGHYHCPARGPKCPNTRRRAAANHH